MVTNEKLVDLVERLENRILVLENRIKSLEINNNSINENREIDLDIYLSMLELTYEDCLNEGFASDRYFSSNNLFM